MVRALTLKRRPFVTYAQSTPSDPAPDQPVWPAVRRGLRRRCPRCGQGHLFEGYLKVASSCPSCRLDLTHQRADDGPAYLTILIVGHLMVPIIHILWSNFRPDPVVMATILSVICVTLSLYLLPRLKGVVIAVQWAKRMHGFGRS